MTEEKKHLKVEEEGEQKVEVKSVHVAMVLDRSGSMDLIANEIVGAFNEQIEEIQKNSEDTPTKVSLFTFATTADEPKVFDENVDTIEKLTAENYKPDGMTAMYDSVGMAVNRLKKVDDADDPGTRFLIIVVSDGKENHSRKFNAQAIAELIKPLRDDGRWTFTYVGANQDLGEVSEAMHISVHNTMSFASTGAGTRRASKGMSRGIGSYYSCLKAQDAGSAEEVVGMFNAADDDGVAVDEDADQDSGQKDPK